MSSQQNNPDDVLGVGSLSGWTRKHFLDELRQIMDAAGDTRTTLVQWDKMFSTLAAMYIGCSDNNLAMTIYNYMDGDFAIRMNYAQLRG